MERIKPFDHVDHLSFSSVKLLSDCPAKFKKRYIDREPIRIVDSMKIGKVVDKALQVAWDEIRLGNIYTGGFDLFLKDESIFKDGIIEFEKGKNHSIAKAYFDLRRDLFEKVFDEDVILQVKVNFAVIDTESGEIMKDAYGYMDAIGKDSNRIHEIKCVGMLNEDSVLKYATDGQTLLYAYAAYTNWELSRFPETVYHFIVKPALKLRKDETDEAFCQRVYDKACELDVRHYVVNSTEDNAQQFYEDFCDQVNLLKEVLPFKNRSSCVVFGERCEYWEQCNKMIEDVTVKPIGETA